MPHPLLRALPVQRWAIVVRGVIQGVGFRPFVYNLARSLGLVGWVQNEADTVRIEIQGPKDRLDQFLATLRCGHPPQARIDAAEVACLLAVEARAGEFYIRPSSDGGSPRPTIPPDLAICAACREEIVTPGERRHGYAFTNCTNCGPRWSIITELPYDRPRTSMAGFPMCADCETEYRDPTDRRFHAQPIACPRCGPQLEFIPAAIVARPDGNGSGRRDEKLHDRTVATSRGPADDSSSQAFSPLEETARAIRMGQIVALKGLGGFQLLVDATNAEAVARLRGRKRRPDKPLAVMLGSLEEIRSRCEVSDEESRVLQSPESPILLLRRRRDRQARRDIAEEVAPGNPYLGVMLPYTPLHQLLMDQVSRPMVCTSGNVSEEPMAVRTEEALARLGSIADVFLVHNRPIVRPVDDSVARVLPEGVQLLRRARGYAPLPIEIGRPGPTVLAVGGHLKNTVALGLGNQVILSQHVGDLDNVASVEVHRQTIDDLLRFFRATPEAIACDLHPDYASTRVAEALAARWNVPLLRVQHHHAHVAACMAEHRLTGRVLGFSWDGTGYGVDGTAWGGEALECVWDDERACGFRRVAALRTFSLPGGDRAAREPRRSAMGLLHELGNDAAPWYAFLGFTAAELSGLLDILARPRLSPRTSSLGRLFDAVAALCRLPGVVSFEGQAAMALEFAADEQCEETYPFHLNESDPVIIDWEPAVRGVLADVAANAPTCLISARFHNGLAEAAVAIARRWGGRDVALSGGCFQNALLARRVRERLIGEGFRVFTHRLVPPNDGGIALGQAAVAAALMAPRTRSGP